MYLKISQKYFSIGDKFTIVDENDQPRFYARERLFTFLKNAELYGLNSMELCKIEGRIFSIWGRYDITQGDNVLGFIKRHPEIIPFVNVWYMDFNGKRYALRSAGYNCKICVADGEKFKHNRKEPIATVSKKMLKVKDTYTVEFDQETLDPVAAALIGLWMDATYHKKNH